MWKEVLLAFLRYFYSTLLKGLRKIVKHQITVFEPRTEARSSLIGYGERVAISYPTATLHVVVVAEAAVLLTAPNVRNSSQSALQ
jgi:hypothetical protein